MQDGELCRFYRRGAAPVRSRRRLRPYAARRIVNFSSSESIFSSVRALTVGFAAWARNMGPTLLAYAVFLADCRLDRRQRLHRRQSPRKYPFHWPYILHKTPEYQMARNLLGKQTIA